MKLIPLLMTTIILINPSAVLADLQQNDLWTSYENQGMDTMTPKKGTGFASTSFSFERQKYKNHQGNLRTKDFTEFIGYGLTDRFTVYGQLERSWDRLSQNETFNNKQNHWLVGSGYRFIDDGKNVVNGIITYGQKNNSFGGGVLKGYSVYGVYGYNAETFAPHTLVGWSQALNTGRQNDEEWYWYIGAGIPLTQNISAELGIDYDRQASTFKTWGGYASASYLWNNSLITEIYSQYVLDNSVKHRPDNYEIDKGYTIGVRLTTAF